MSAKVRWLAVLALPVLICLAVPAAAQQASTAPGLIVGRIIDQGSRRPISGVSVAVGDSTVRAISDEQGRFAVDGAPPGPLQLTFSMIGYTRRTESLTVRPGATQEIEVTLSREAIQLDPIDVSVRSGWLESSGFYERETSNPSGTFIDKDEIEQRNPRQLTDMLRGVPGLRTVYLDAGRIHVRFNREAGNDVLAFEQDPDAETLPGCEPDLYLDGILYRERAAASSGPRVTGFNIVDVGLVEGIEAYSGPNAPLQYQHVCGVILIWTSRGRPAGTASRRTTPSTPVNVAVMPELEQGTLIRIRPRFGPRITGQVALVDGDSLVMRQGEDRSTFTLLDMRSLERDGGYATPMDRIRRGGKWGFLLSVIGVAVTAAVEEFQGLGDRMETIPDNSVRKPSITVKVIAAGTLTGALLGGSLWRYRHWVDVPIR